MKISTGTIRATLKGRLGRFCGLGLCVLYLAGCADDDISGPGDSPHPKELSGGATTIFNNTTQAFGFPAPNLSASNLDKHLAGDLAFEASFVAPPAEVNSGLGPVFNNTACVNCHPTDGRGRPPLPGRMMESMLIRLSLPGIHPHIPNAPNPVPGFGTQLADKALFGVAVEGRAAIHYSEIPGSFADGEPYTLQRPGYIISDTYIPLPAGIMMSPRVALPVFGRGLLEAIPEQTLLELADENDADGDGISGRPNYAWDALAGATRIGRFGWKAATPTLYQQSAAAYNEDMGITNSLFRAESAHGQPQDDGMNDDPEVSDEDLENVTFYVQTLAVPARRNINDKRVIRGEQLFAAAKCASCHTPELRTGHVAGIPEISNQTIRPYTDMLLHDMGAELADGRPDFEATGREWRTPPLWGLGLTDLVHGHTFLLHDGRARTIMEAILWHGGEAEASREFVRKLSKSDREALLAFLNSL